MHIRFGYEITYDFPQPTPMVLMLHAHPSRAADLVRPDAMRTNPTVPLTIYHDGFGNTCTRLVAPAGPFTVTADALIHDSGRPEPLLPQAAELPLHVLPSECFQYLLASRYCETELLMNEAWRLFGHLTPGWQRAQAVCDFAHRHVRFGYPFARNTKTALEAYRERQGVCRDFAHLAITMLRCLNIPARYCTGYLGDIGVPACEQPMDFAGWLEAYLDGNWHTFDPRNNQRRIGRILIGRGRDAADVAISTTFGPNTLQSFRVWTDEVPDTAASTTVGADQHLIQHAMPIEAFA